MGTAQGYIFKEETKERLRELEKKPGATPADKQIDSLIPEKNPKLKV